MSHQKVIGRVPPEGPNSRWYSELEDAFRMYTPTLDPVSIAANTTVEQTFPVAGVNSADMIVVNKPSIQAGISVAGARATGANEIGITFVNATASPVDPISEAYIVLAIRG